MHGNGKFEWPDGKYYEGNYKHGKKNGYGKLETSELIYIG